MQPSWKLNIQARTHIFNLKLKATKILPTGDCHRFSLFLRLHNFILKLQLNSGSSLSISTQQKTTLKSTFLSLLEKLRLRRTKKNPDFSTSILDRVKHLVNKKSNYAGSLVIAILALLLQSISKKDGIRKGIVIHVSIITLYYWILNFNGKLTGKGRRFFWMILIVGTAGSWAAFNLGRNYVSGNAWNWIEWSYGSSVISGFWYAVSQLIFSLVKIFFSHILKLREK